MKKTVYIHIGSPKTGTTSIQQFLTVNSERLLKEGLFYPIIGRQYTENDLLRLHKDGNNLARSIDPKGESIAICMNGSSLTKNSYDENNFKELLKKFSASKSNVMLLSEEVLFIEYQDNICNRPHLFKHLSKYEIKIIVYLKRSVEYLCGLWQEELRNKSTVSLEYYLENHQYAECLQVINDLAKKVGDKNIIVKSFEKESWTNGNLIDDFLSIFKIKNSSKFKGLKNNNNISLSRERNEMMRYINRYLDISIEHNDYGINQKIPVGKNDQKILDSLPDGIIKKTSDKYYPYECEISKKVLGKKELFAHKYPKIYKTKRDEYINKIAEDDKGELQFSVNAILQKQILERQDKMVNLQHHILKKDPTYISKCYNKIVYQYGIKKSLALVLCSFIPSKECRANLRKRFLDKKDG
jgi:hypothetical protein